MRSHQKWDECSEESFIRGVVNPLCERAGIEPGLLTIGPLMNLWFGDEKVDPGRSVAILSDPGDE